MKPITHYSMCLYKALQQETGQVGIIGISVFTLRMQPFSFSVICLIIFGKPSYHLIFCSLWYVLRPRPTTLEEFDNIGFTLKTHQMFFVHTTPVSGITWLSWRHHFRKARFENVIGLHENKKPVFSNFSGLKGVFRKVPSPWRVSMDRRLLNRGKK